DALDPHVELPARQRLRDDADESVSAEVPRAVDLDDEREDVLPVHEDLAVVGERKLTGRDRLQCRPRVEEKRVPPRAGERTDAVLLAARVFAYGELQLRTVGARADTDLRVARLVEDAVELHLVL